MVFLLRDLFRKYPPLSQPGRWSTTTNRDLVIGGFPARLLDFIFVIIHSFYIFHYCNRLLLTFFYDIQSKCALINHS